ncbi:MAG: hypothetical protein ACYDBY_15225 [Thermoanaerobaculia bacterium]
MAGLLDIPAALMQIGLALEATAGQVDQTRTALARLEAQAKKTGEATSSSVARAKGSPAGTMGSSSGASGGGAGVPKAVTAAGTIAALKNIRGRLK